MTDPVDHLDEEYYRSLLDQLTTEFPWERRKANSTVRDQIERAADGSRAIGELRLRHDRTDAYADVNFPNYQSGHAARILVYHPLDRDLPRKEAGFVGSLGRAHQIIASRYDSEYLVPMQDPKLVQVGCIPSDYSTQNLFSMKLSITSTALRIQRLHESIQQPVTEVLQSSTVPPNGPELDAGPCFSVKG